MPLILGIDPGSYITGYGLASVNGRKISYAGSGIIKVSRKKPKAARLMEIKEGVDGIIRRFDPDEIAVESIFIARNPKSALALGESRGVILLSAVEAGKKIFEYSPREIKRSVVGNGAAHKSQVARMIEKLFRFERRPSSSDESDALAVVFCHHLRISSKLEELI